MSTESLRIFSYNIRCNLWSNGAYIDGENQWAFRKDRVASVLRLYALDLIALQEVLLDQLQAIEAQLPEFGWIGVGREDGADAGEFTPIFYRRSALSIHNSGTFWLSETPDVAGSKGWDGRCVRIATWACFEHVQSGHIFYHFNTHLDHLGEIARVEGIRLLQKRIADIAKGTPTIITGDFNCTEKDPPYQMATDASDANTMSPLWQDTKYLSMTAHHGPSGTFNHRFCDPVGDKIDYIFLCQQTSKQTGGTQYTGGTLLQVQQHAVLADHWDGRYPSDHLPVFVNLLFK